MSNYAENIIKILAGLPEFLRKPMLKSRLEEFFDMNKEEKMEIINNALDAMPEIEFNTLAKLIRTWIEVLDRFDVNKREEIFSLYAYMLANKPEIISRLDIKGLLSIYNSLNDDLKKNVSIAIRDAINRLEDKDALLAKIPEEARRLFY